ncbi:MAG: hypothetical protein ACXVW2_17140 [Nocardioidaceae bacterium]
MRHRLLRSRAARRVAAAVLAATARTVAAPPASAASASRGAHGSTALLKGSVTHDGRPQAGALVTVAAWPDAARLTGLRSGAQVTLLPLGSVRTDAAGRFVVPRPTALPAAGYVDPSGSLSLDVTVSDGAAEVSWNVPAAAVTPAATTVTASDRAPLRRPTPDLLVETGREPGVADRNALPRTWAGVADTTAAGLLPAQRRQLSAAEGQAFAFAARTAAVAASPAVPAVGCVVTATSTYYNADEIFASVYAWSGALATVYQTTGTTHTLGVGLKSSAGVWSSSGTVSFNETTGAGASVPGVADAYAHNIVRYRDYYYGSPCNYTKRIPSSTYGLLTGFTYAGHTRFSHCAPMVKGGQYWKDQGTNVTYAAGVDLGAIDVSAQSGWNTATKLTWNLTSASVGCGSTTGWASAPQMDVRATA